MKKKYIIASIFILSVLFTLASFGVKYLRDRANISMNPDNNEILVPELVAPDQTALSDGITIEDSLESTLRKNVSAKFNRVEGDIQMTLLQSDNKFARGTALVKDVAGEVYILARHANTAWEVLYADNKVAPCSIVDTYGVPENIMPECMNSNGTLKTRLVP